MTLRNITISAFLAISSLSFAQDFPAISGPGEMSDYSQIVVDSIWEQLGHPAPAPIPVRKEVVDNGPDLSPDTNPDMNPDYPSKKDGVDYEIDKVDKNKINKTLKRPTTVKFDDKKKVVKKEDGPLKIDRLDKKI